ncbi:MAG: VOC family protein [Sphingomonas sp.]|jgi:catechol 2,3-dioxygenase-like lactoylglutathione lyase family enzyme|uniref:VOC family protein n=1 Tax=Sphingomonas sp. TaxID=28214 RepID=UPI0035671F85
MLDHIGLAVTDFARSRAFYEAALAPLGITVLEVIDENEAGGTAVMMGDSEPFFVFADNEQPGEGTHVAFRASSRAQVDGFYEAAMAAGGKDNGAPGIRAQYHPNYYAAFVFDPDGINVEAVCHLPG